MDKILSVVTNKDVCNYSYKVARGNDLHRDIISEIIIYLTDLEQEKFDNIYDLKSYVCKMIYFSWNSTTSPFYIKYRNDYDYKYIEKSKIIDDSATQELNEIEYKISKKRYPTEVRLFEMYVELGSYRKVAEKVGIDHCTVYKLVESVRNEMKKRL